MGLEGNFQINTTLYAVTVDQTGFQNLLGLIKKPRSSLRGHSSIKKRTVVPITETVVIITWNYPR